jgi:hypothetical protein
MGAQTGYPRLLRASRPRVAGAIGIMLVAAGAAQAHTFCVSTAAELQTALDKSSTGGTYDGEDNVIHLAPNTYHTGSATGNGPFHFASTAAFGISLMGGWTADCASFNFDATSAMLDGGGAGGTPVLKLNSTQGNVTVFSLTIQNGDSDSVGAGLNVNSTFGDNGNVTIINNIIKNNHTSQQNGGLVVETGGGPMILQSNLIVGNSADLGNGAGEVAGNGTVTYFFNNTVVQNTTALTNGVGGLNYEGISDCDIASNIFFGNDNVGLYLASGAHVVLEYNDYGTIGGVAPGGSVGNVSVNPQFVNAAGGNFRVAAGSPVIGISPRSTFGGNDLDGNAYPIGGFLDLGAYQRTIFADGFDGE